MAHSSPGTDAQGFIALVPDGPHQPKHSTIACEPS